MNTANEPRNTMEKINFVRFLSESKDQLDISILAAHKFLTSAERIEDFLSSEVTVEHKTDGVKLTVVKQANNGNINDYIFAYKGNILYTTEYDYQPSTKVKKESIGASQFKIVFAHFSTLGKNTIPVGTELFIEFLMSKPTLSSNYNTKHKMVLIGTSNSTWVESFGKLKTTPSGFNVDKRDEYAKELKIDTPQVLFQGIIGSELTFSRGIKHDALKREFTQRKGSMKWNIPELLLDDVRALFLSIESKYGGTEEGVVIKYNGRMLKWQQEYQLDQEARTKIKSKYREADPLSEQQYWDNVKRTALELVSAIVVKSRKLDEILSELSLMLKRHKLDFTHSSKTETVIKDDIQLNAKTLLIKQMRGNNNALIVGKFRIFTKEGHYKLIKRASTLYDNVVVCLVTSAETAKTKDLREDMIRKCFPGVHVIHASNGNILSIINKSPVNINVIYAGTDRVAGYQQQIKNNIGMSVKELPRSDSSISASKVIENINDQDFFEKNTPREIHDLYNTIKEVYA